MKTKMIDIVFDGPPSHESGRFVETEDCYGKSLGPDLKFITQWVQRIDGYWVLRLEAVVQNTIEPPNFEVYGHRKDLPKW